MNDSMSTLKKVELYGFFICLVLCVVAVWYMQTSYNLLSLQASTTNTQTAAVGQVTVSSDQSRAGQLGAAFDDNGRLSSMVIEDIKFGSGGEVESGSRVQLHYTARLVTGELVEDSRRQGNILAFRQGRGSVAAGLDEGVLGMKEGGTRVVVVPSELVHRNNRQRGVSSNSPLVYTIELISVNR